MKRLQFPTHWALVTLLLLSARPALAQVDLADAAGRAGADVSDVKMRVRVVRCEPPRDNVAIAWRHGGEGLGGTVTRGAFATAKKETAIPVGAWTDWLPLTQVAGGGGGWKFPTITVSVPNARKSEPLASMSVEFQFARKEAIFKTFTEESPKGATVGFAAHAGAKTRAEFESSLAGLSAHARARRELLEKALGAPAPTPSRFSIIGHLSGYGEGSGYGIRHCNPEIVRQECETLRLLGMNGLVDERSETLADAAGMGQQFRKIYWGSSGIGSPDGFFRRSKDPSKGCPFDPALRTSMDQSAHKALAQYEHIHAEENWGIAWDEIGVAAKEHINACPRCADEFRNYLKKLKLEPAAFGKESWEQITPYALWVAGGSKKKKGSAPGFSLAPAPASPADALRYYYTYRFMTHATADLFPQAAQALLKSGVRMYAMQGPTPTWGGHSLDWHEFYDLGANTALVWETSNRDARVWQWESYLADTMRGISQRHDLPIGCLIKPHRGAPAQRMLTAVARGVQRFEWYTYGPDYAKGDSFSQSPALLEEVARAGRFLASAEDALYGAQRAGCAEVAFVTPRSSEIWGKSSPAGVADFEDAKWVYMALAHAHVPVDVLSEQQLAEGKLHDYRVAYVIGPHLHHDAAKNLRQWVEAGGVLWTDALGLSRDEANQPSTLADLLPSDRKAEVWGGVEPYHAVGLQPFTGNAAPETAAVAWESAGAWGSGKIVPGVGRVTWDAAGAEVLAKFADGKPAVVRRAAGKGQVVTAGFWAGLTYSAKVRRPDFNMRTDYDAAARNLIAASAIEHGVYRPVVTSDPLVEAILLDNKGRKSVALINWGYRADVSQPNGAMPMAAESLTIRLTAAGDVKTVRSVVAGELPVKTEGDQRVVVLPRLEKVDVLVLNP